MKGDLKEVCKDALRVADGTIYISSFKSGMMFDILDAGCVERGQTLCPGNFQEN